MPLTILQLLQLARQKKVNFLDAEILIAHLLKKQREFILANPNHQITKKQDTRYKQLLKQRQRDVPLAYITGHKEFFGLDFLVNKNVLVPRPDTELMVELVLTHITNHVPHNKKIVLIDVGTGSGCIPISLLKSLKQDSIKTFAIDISKAALAVAKKNAKKDYVKIKFLRGNLLEPFFKTYKLTDLQTCKLIITANLPYLTPKQVKEEPSIKQEPKLALVAGHDGLKYYKKLFFQIRKLFLIPNSLFLYIEIDPSQTKSIKLLIKKILPTAKVVIHKDLAGKNRVVEISV